MKKILSSVLLCFGLFLTLSSCAQKKKTFTGTFSNGMKGDKISFVLSADGKWVEDLTFDGYWRCSGRLEQTKVGPDKKIAVKNGKISGIVVDPENGGSTAWRFDLQGVLSGNKASGTFRMNINALGCDTYLLKWTATAK